LTCTHASCRHACHAVTQSRGFLSMSAPQHLSTSACRTSSCPQPHHASNSAPHRVRTQHRKIPMLLPSNIAVAANAVSCDCCNSHAGCDRDRT
jgi:hypothetical protein